MNVYTKALIGVIVFGGFLWGLWMSVVRLPSDGVSKVRSNLNQMETQGVPSFEGPTLAGGKFSLQETKGKVTIVSFWATWCGPCAEEFPSFVKLLKHYKGQVSLVAVSLDDHPKDVENFLKAFGGPVEGLVVVMDPEQKISTLYGTEKLPESYILTADHKLLRKVAGSMDWASPSALGYFDEAIRGNGK